MEKTNNWDKINSKWKQFSGDVKKKWGMLTNDELAHANGNRGTLGGKNQKKHDDEAHKPIDVWGNKLTI